MTAMRICHADQPLLSVQTDTLTKENIYVWAPLPLCQEVVCRLIPALLLLAQQTSGTNVSFRIFAGTFFEDPASVLVMCF